MANHPNRSQAVLPVQLELTRGSMERILSAVRASQIAARSEVQRMAYAELWHLLEQQFRKAREAA